MWYSCSNGRYEMYSHKSARFKMEDSFVRLSQSAPRRSGHDSALGTVLTLSVATLVKSSRADPRLISCSPHDLFSHLMGISRSKCTCI